MTLARVACAYFATFCERLGGDEVRGALDGAGQPGDGDLDGHGHRRAGRERAQRGLEAAVGEDRGVDAARELAQLVEARLQLAGGALEQLAELGVGAGARARSADQQRERDEAGLGAVVEVALEAAALGVARLDEAGARRAQLLEALAQLGVEVADVAAEQPAEERERRHAGGDEGGPPRGLAGAGASDRHEQEGQQRAGVDGRELQALEGVGRAPAAHRAGEDDREQGEVEQRARAGERVGDGGVAADEEQVGRAAVAAELVGTGEQQGRHEREREDHVAGDREARGRGPTQPAGREAQAEVEEDAAPDAAGDERKRVERGEFAASSVNRNHAKPRRTMSAPVRFSGRRRQA